MSPCVSRSGSPMMWHVRVWRREGVCHRTIISCCQIYIVIINIIVIIINYNKDTDDRELLQRSHNLVCNATPIITWS